MDGEEVEDVGIPQRIERIGQCRVYGRNGGSYREECRYLPAVLRAHIDERAKTIEESEIKKSLSADLRV
ncbi:hypothetical protein RRF57_010471 [Xylaria bambusicola]|uniref:Uncharacterized protein n=1 Tax=Xylaria bambusicola TaxID=326684 RepID=A0AAN7UWP1_9PEZI